MKKEFTFNLDVVNDCWGDTPEDFVRFVRSMLGLPLGGPPPYWTLIQAVRNLKRKK